MSNVSTFIKEYVRAIIEGYAAVFAGAGLSRASGYVNWKDLVRPLAEEIGLDVNKEHDLVAVAQYYRNERGSRFSINQKILNEFTKDTMQNKNIEILARLPIKTYWTTNYDELLESALERNNKKADVKTTQESLANNICDRDAVVYKMHGDVRDPAKTVVTKDDYEIYGNERPLFRTALQGDLISKTFLFIGFSFEDPNLDHILSQIRILLGESSRDHYCFFERVKKRENDENQQEFSYNVAKQELRIKDLRRYGIQAVLLDTYSEITCILREIESSVLRKNIFISGALAEYEPPWNKESVDNFTFSLAQDLVKHDYRIISGFGKGIGSTIINGALEEIMRSKYKHVDEYLCLRPFPQIVSGGLPRGELWKRYREDMISQAGIAVFLFGNKEVDGNVVFSDGMLEEFEIARKLGKIIIPVGSTGGAAARIFNVVKEGLKDYPYLVDYCDQLQTEVDSGKLVELVRKIIHKQQVV